LLKEKIDQIERLKNSVGIARMKEMEAIFRALLSALVVVLHANKEIS